MTKSNYSLAEARRRHYDTATRLNQLIRNETVPESALDLAYANFMLARSDLVQSKQSAKRIGARQ